MKDQLAQMQIKQTQSLFKFMLQNDAMLCIAIISNPKDPDGSVKFCKDAGVPDKSAIMLLRKFADELENGTVKIAYTE